MSEVITVGTASETIHGTFDAGVAYISMLYGEAADAWLALPEDSQKRTLASAVRYLNAQNWDDDYDTFEKRDAIAAFAIAEYELAVLIADDASIVAESDQGSNIASLGAGSASISFFHPTTRGADRLPPVLMRLVGQYLAASRTRGANGGSGESSDARNPFSDCSDFDPNGPW